MCSPETEKCCCETKNRSSGTLFFNFCSFLGALAFIYTAIQVINLHPDIQFSAVAPEVLSEDKKSIEKNFSGILMNKSLAPNSIVSISLSVFDMKTKERVYDGYSGEKIFRTTGSGSQEIFLPINLNPKEAIGVDFVSFIPTEGDLKGFLDESKPPKEKYAFVLLLTDINGNVFNSRGQRMPQSCLDKKWIGDSSTKVNTCFLMHDLGTLLSSFGLTKF